MSSPRPATADHGLFGLFGLASFVAFFVGTSQALVPLLARGLAGRRPALSIAARWPAPWWWLGCIAFGVAAFAALVAIDNAKARHASAEHPSTEPTP